MSNIETTLTRLEANRREKVTCKTARWPPTTRTCLLHLYLGSSTQTTMYPMYPMMRRVPTTLEESPSKMREFFTGTKKYASFINTRVLPAFSCELSTSQAKCTSCNNGFQSNKLTSSLKKYLSLRYRSDPRFRSGNRLVPDSIRSVDSNPGRQKG
jgi:hypothetical protein